MKILQNIYDDQFAKLFRPEKIISEYISNKCKTIGVQLNKKQIRNLEEQFKDIKGNSFSIDIGDKQIKKAGYKTSEEFNKLIIKELKNIIPDLENKISKFNNALPNVLQDLINQTSDKLYKRLIKTSKRMFKDRRNYLNKFENNLFKKWGDSINYLEMLLVLSTESAEQINFNNNLKNINSDQVFNVLIRLHARSCQITSEIIALLKTGHAEDRKSVV